MTQKSQLNPVVIEVLPEQRGLRLDALLVAVLPEFSRGRATDHIAQGHVRMLAGAGKVKPSLLVSKMHAFEVDVQPRPQLSAEPQEIELEIIYEDADLLVVNKPAGMVVHPAAGHEGGTLVNALLHHAPQLRGLGEEFRPGLVHRIDKDTSGLLVVSKTDQAMRKLALDFAAHRLERRYAAILLGTLPDGTLTLRSLHGRHPTDRKRFSGRVKDGKAAVTHLQVQARSAICCLVIATLETGRSHQIRMHCSECGHPIAGDALYGGVRNFAKTEKSLKDILWLQQMPRQALHAYALGFQHPRTGQQLRFAIDWPADLKEIAVGLFGDDAELPDLAEAVFRG